MTNQHAEFNRLDEAKGKIQSLYGTVNGGKVFTQVNLKAEEHMLKQILITNLDVSYIIILSRVMRAAPHIKKKWPFDQYFSLHPLPGVFAHLKLKDREKVVVGFIKIPFQRIFQEFVKRIMRRPNGIFSVLLAMRRCRERGKTEFYLVTADSHPCKSRTRTFDLIIQGTKRGLFSEITHQTTQLFAIILWSSHKRHILNIFGSLVKSGSYLPEA